MVKNEQLHYPARLTEEYRWIKERNNKSRPKGHLKAKIRRAMRRSDKLYLQQLLKEEL